MGPEAKPFLEGPGPDAAQSFQVSAWSRPSVSSTIGCQLRFPK